MTRSLHSYSVRLLRVMIEIKLPKFSLIVEVQHNNLTSVENQSVLSSDRTSCVQGRLNLGGNEAFCAIRELWGDELKTVPIDSQRSPRLPSWIWGVK